MADYQTVRGGVISNFLESTPNGRDLDRVLQSD